MTRATDVGRGRVQCGPVRVNPDSSCAAIAAAQHGVISARQARAAGLSRDQIWWRLDRGRWKTPLPTAYIIHGAPDVYKQQLMAAVVWLGVDGAASHRAAARLLGLRGFEAAEVEVSTTGRKRTPDGKPLVHHVSRLLAQELTRIDGITTTGPARTMVDLCAVLYEARAEQALDEMLRRELTTLDELRGYLDIEARQGRRGVRMLRRLLNERDPSYIPTDSELETQLVTLITSAGLPDPVRQHPLFDGDKLLRVYDFAYPSALVGIEAQSYEFHGDRVTWSKDQVKDNRAAVLGWTTLRYTRFDVDDRPSEVIAEIADTLDRAPHPTLASK